MDIISKSHAIIDRKILKNKNKQPDALKLNIRASHSGKLNKNLMFYTPRAMEEGSDTLIVPYAKSLQDEHFSYSVGVVTGSEYISYENSLPSDILKLKQNIDNAVTPKELVANVKELIKHPFYTSKHYKGLGSLQVDANLHDSAIIKQLVKGSITGEVSIGGKSTQVYCSICSDILDVDHEENVHSRGNMYGGEMCFGICDDLILDHIGFVPDPADPNTSTTIIKDSTQSYESFVEVEEIKIKDNIQGPRMKFEELKVLMKDINSFVNIDGTTEEQRTKLVDFFSTSTKGLRQSGYLIPEDKLLPINNKEMVAFTKQALSKLEDSEDKEIYLELLKPHEMKHFTEGESAEEVLKALLVSIEEEKKKQENPDNADKGDNDGSTDESGKSDPEQGTQGSDGTDGKGEDVDAKQQFSLDEDMIEKLATSVASKLQEAQKSVQVADSVGVKVTLQRINQLEKDIEIVDANNKELREAYKQSLISNILLIKGLEKDSDYAKLLQNRDINVLKANLEDLEFEKGFKTATNTSTDDKQPEDVNEDKKSDEGKQPDELSKVSIQDSLNRLQTTEQTPKASDDLRQSVIRSGGLAAYLQKLGK